MRSYETARGLLGFLGFCSRLVIAAGAIVLFLGLTFGANTNGALGAVQIAMFAAPGVLTAILGLYGLAFVQMARAGVDSAEYGQQSLDVARKQLEISRQALEQNRKIEATYAALVARKPSEQPVEKAQFEGPSYADRTAQNSAMAPAATASATVGNQVAIGASHSAAELPPPTVLAHPAVEHQQTIPTQPDATPEGQPISRKKEPKGSPLERLVEAQKSTGPLFRDV